MLPCVCSVIDHRGHQNVVRTSVKHSAVPRVPLFCFLPHFDFICDLLLNRRMQHGIYLLNALAFIHFFDTYHVINPTKERQQIRFLEYSHFS